ncbi:ribonuclease P protein component [Georgenia subflava]|uniref:Ribonuclease P protein component n=1 Tax=Georgenia subflava TaxID=1622177 RepID=A0A6N7EIM7_9MICO|nr:ribonuclease P protein component [Georgenia subflava]MPV37930.1 ribonuclease P protein component [Georgenia subflava]
MLPPRHRMRRADQFSDAVRRGARSGARRLVVHLGAGRTDDLEPTSSRTDDAALVGFVVPKAVGNAVRRNEVKRRLRHLMAARAGDLPAGTHVVVRALPAAAGATSTELAADLDAALAGARRRAERTTAATRGRR